MGQKEGVRRQRLARAFPKTGAHLRERWAPVSATMGPTFADNDTISEWAFAAVGKVQANGIMNGVGNNNFSPLTDYTREQSIITMVRMMEHAK